MPLLEIVRTIRTSEDTVDALKAVGARLGKTTVVAKDTPGCIVSALLIPYLLDATCSTPSAPWSTASPRVTISTPP